MTIFPDDRYGSAAFACYHEIRAAGLLGDEGLYIGHVEDDAMNLPGDKSGIICAGAGAGKGTGLIIPMILKAAQDGENIWVTDPKGELAAVTLWYFVCYGILAYVWNPYGLHRDIGMPQHRMNPFDSLRRGHKRLAANCRLFAESLIPLSGGNNSQYFELAARDIVDAFLQCLVDLNGSVTLPELVDALTAIATDPEIWADFMEAMEKSSSAHVRRVAREMWSKRRDAAREFWGIYGTVMQAFGFMNDPCIRESVSASDFYLGDQCRDDGIARAIFFVAPAEYAQQLAPLTRLIFTGTFLSKSEAPSAPQITMVLDESGQLGRFEMIPRALTYARGIGIRAVVVYQDLGQIEKAFGQAGMQSIIGSCQFRIFFGIRDPHSAGYVSKFLGNETRSVTDSLQRNEAKRRSEEALRRFLEGGDPLSAAHEYVYFERASHNEGKIQRPLLTLDEILNLPEGQMIVMVAGLNLRPILARKIPYYQRRSLSGKWHPNPYVGDSEHVTIPTFWGRRKRRVIVQPVPAHLVHLPQHQSGSIRYIEGFKTWNDRDIAAFQRSASLGSVTAVSPPSPPE